MVAQAISQITIVNVCLADDARTVVAPFKRVSSLETLYRLINYVGGDPEQCRREIKTWGHGGCWADVKREHYVLLGIRKMPQALGARSGNRSLTEGAEGQNSYRK